MSSGNPDYLTLRDATRRIPKSPALKYSRAELVANEELILGDIRKWSIKKVLDCCKRRRDPQSEIRGNGGNRSSSKIVVEVFFWLTVNLNSFKR